MINTKQIRELGDIAHDYVENTELLNQHYIMIQGELLDAELWADKYYTNLCDTATVYFSSKFAQLPMKIYINNVFYMDLNTPNGEFPLEICEIKNVKLVATDGNITIERQIKITPMNIELSVTPEEINRCEYSDSYRGLITISWTSYNIPSGTWIDIFANNNLIYRTQQQVGSYVYQASSPTEIKIGFEQGSTVINTNEVFVPYSPAIESQLTNVSFDATSAIIGSDIQLSYTVENVQYLHLTNLSHNITTDYSSTLPANGTGDSSFTFTLLGDCGEKVNYLLEASNDCTASQKKRYSFSIQCPGDEPNISLMTIMPSVFSINALLQDISYFDYIVDPSATSAWLTVQPSNITLPLEIGIVTRLYWNTFITIPQNYTITFNAENACNTVTKTITATVNPYSPPPIGTQTWRNVVIEKIFNGPVEEIPSNQAFRITSVSRPSAGSYTDFTVGLTSRNAFDNSRSSNVFVLMINDTASQNYGGNDWYITDINTPSYNDWELSTMNIFPSTGSNALFNTQQRLLSVNAGGIDQITLYFVYNYKRRLTVLSTSPYGETDPSGYVDAEPGDVININAIDTSANPFTRWTTPNGANINDINAKSTFVTMGNRSATVYANFNDTPHYIRYWTASGLFNEINSQDPLCNSTTSPKDLTDIVRVSFGSLFTDTSISDWFLNGASRLQIINAIPNTVTSIGNYFMEGCVNFNNFLNLPNNLQTIGNGFLWRAYNFNRTLNLPASLTSIGNYFLYAARSFNQPLTIPDGVTVLQDGFMAYTLAFNSVLTLPAGLQTISTNFLTNATTFDKAITIPNVTSIGSYFMSKCYAFSRPIVMPASINTIGTNIFENSYNMTSIISWLTPAIPTDAYTFSAQDPSASTYVEGIRISGPYTEQILAALPNSDVKPYRNLRAA